MFFVSLLVASRSAYCFMLSNLYNKITHPCTYATYYSSVLWHWKNIFFCAFDLWWKEPRFFFFFCWIVGDLKCFSCQPFLLHRHNVFTIWVHICLFTFWVSHWIKWHCKSLAMHNNLKLNWLTMRVIHWFAVVIPSQPQWTIYIYA